MPLSSVSPGSLLDSPLASTLTTSSNQAVSTGARLHSGPATGATPAYASLDPLTQDLITLLKALAYGDLAGARSDLAKYKADLKAQTTAAANGQGKDVATLSRSASTGASSSTQNNSGSDSLVASISASLSSGSVQGALHDLTGYLVQHGQASGGLINTLG